MNTLDVTDFRETDRLELHKAIEDAVGDTQRVVIRQLPDELLISKQQFEILKPGMEETYIEDFFIYQTKHNVMEVRLKEND